MSLLHIVFTAKLGGACSEHGAENKCKILEGNPSGKRRLEPLRPRLKSDKS
jgi:hypothetical protein